MAGYGSGGLKPYDGVPSECFNQLGCISPDCDYVVFLFAWLLAWLVRTSISHSSLPFVPLFLYFIAGATTGRLQTADLYCLFHD